MTNLVSLVDKYGFAPDGSRIYFTNRSQPSLLRYTVVLVLSMIIKPSRKSLYAGVDDYSQNSYVTSQDFESLCESQIQTQPSRVTLPRNMANCYHNIRGKAQSPKCPICKLVVYILKNNPCSTLWLQYGKLGGSEIAERGKRPTPIKMMASPDASTFLHLEVLPLVLK
ncbi:hypothetical protein VNO77_07455 [Canavalia gladiata]|uniref:Uncharacterized protein n=1 Tax=Canavalia gladiata TaxID=3824 RepID=A0AAN9M8F3_CANGL